jgi:hypothetical protein
MSQEVDKMLSRAITMGWRVKRTGGNHIKAMSPDGNSVVVISGTPSDHRAIMNIRAAFRRAGLDL